MWQKRGVRFEGEVQVDGEGRENLRGTWRKEGSEDLTHQLIQTT